jgi:uncharacterized HAD superfamily protein
MKLGIDLDGVLYNWTDFSFRYCVEQGYTNRSIDYFFSHEEEHTSIFWHNLVRMPFLYYKTPFKKEYKILIDKFASSGWEIFYLTNRPEEVKVTTYNWLEDSHVPYLDNLYFVDKKSSIIRFENIDYHIDDRGKCIEDIKNFCSSYLISTPWNLDYKEPKNCKRIDNLLEVEELLY